MLQSPSNISQTGSAGNAASTGVAFDATAITRPDPALMTYYIIVSLCTVAGFPFVILPLYFKYRTLQYKFDDKGVSMKWGIMFHKEIYLTYRRIQDIHVTRNFIQRWLGLSSVAVQTASGGGGAEMTIEGVIDPEGLRDYLYTKMRGVRDHTAPEATAQATGLATAAPGGVASADDEALSLLHEIRDELRALRNAPSGH